MMTMNDPSDKLRNGLILNLESSINEILEGIGEIKSDIKVLRLENGQHTKELKKADSRFTTAIKKTNDRITLHLKDHTENTEFMGISPFMRKLGKKHWKILFGGLLAAQVALAALLMKYGIEKIIGLFTR